jgi:hypothetical protein
MLSDPGPEHDDPPDEQDIDAINTLINEHSRIQEPDFQNESFTNFEKIDKILSSYEAVTLSNSKRRAIPYEQEEQKQILPSEERKSQDDDNNDELKLEDELELESSGDLDLDQIELSSVIPSASAFKAEPTTTKKRSTEQFESSDFVLSNLDGLMLSESF